MIAGIEMSAESEPETEVQTVPAPRRRYSLAELLAQCEGGPLTQEDREWLDAPAVGSEIGALAIQELTHGAVKSAAKHGSMPQPQCPSGVV
jgi:hypothetical protein